MRQEPTSKIYVNIKDYVDPNKPNSTGKPMFFIWDKKYTTISWMIQDVSTETKTIVPKSWKNAGKDVIIHNLIIDMVDAVGEMSLQLPLYSQIGNSVLNMLAGPKPFQEEFFFSVYKK